MRERLSRREALAAGLAGAAALAIAPAAAGAASAEADALTALMRAELDAMFVYRESRLDRADLPPEGLAVLEAGGGAARRQAAMAYERSLIAGCAQRLAQLEDPNTVRTVATVMAGHAQHLVLHELMSRR